MWENEILIQGSFEGLGGKIAAQTTATENYLMKFGNLKKGSPYASYTRRRYMYLFIYVFQGPPAALRITRNPNYVLRSTLDNHTYLDTHRNSSACFSLRQQQSGARKIRRTSC